MHYLQSTLTPFPRAFFIKSFIVASTLIALTGCTGLIEAGTYDEMYKSFNTQDYQKTLTLIRRAEHLNNLDSQSTDELIYMKARTLEAMGNVDESNALYHHLQLQHKSSQYASLAQLRLEQNAGSKLAP